MTKNESKIKLIFFMSKTPLLKFTKSDRLLKLNQAEEAAEEAGPSQEELLC